MASLQNPGDRYSVFDKVENFGRSEEFPDDHVLLGQLIQESARLPASASKTASAQVAGAVSAPCVTVVGLTAKHESPYMELCGRVI
jgi:hypothetical protein